MLATGELLSKDRLAECYRVFRDRFAPDVLQRLDGEALLDTMHKHGVGDSLVYWLEFKDDQELPAAFGSISGGCALKFGIYKRQETGEWTTGSPQHQRAISVDEAVTIARTHRDQLIRGTELLKAFATPADEAAYWQLQRDMDTEAPDVSRLAWGHKYFSMLFPETLDDFHSPAYQRYHLVRALQMPFVLVACVSGPWTECPNSRVPDPFVQPLATDYSLFSSSPAFFNLSSYHS